jgi:isoleucyl-tRNA synthetase
VHRFNRKRLKGEDGLEDTVTVLNMLFKTLFTLCWTMRMWPTPSPKQSAEIRQSLYTPFLTVNVYQGFKLFIPKDLMAGDTRSIHFLLFPEVKEEYFEEVVEQQVKRRQTVNKLTRNIRERLNMSLKVGDSSVRGGTNPYLCRLAQSV